MLTALAVTLLVVRSAVGALLDTIPAQVHVADIADGLASAVTAAGVVTLSLGLLLPAWASLSE